jgi:hypothetical protein
MHDNVTISEKTKTTKKVFFRVITLCQLNIRNIIHGSDGAETGKAAIALLFQPKELVSYTSNEEKWIYWVN